ncbi:unnamed protein product, partial [marine sediment metagenome]
MWLPKDERKLLALYFHKTGKPDEQETLKDNDDMKALGWKESESNEDYDRQYINRVWNADDILKKREFLNVLNRAIGEKTVSLTLKGYDLGRKYSSRWTKSGLWFAEYKHHWIWLIVSFLGGIMGA